MEEVKYEEVEEEVEEVEEEDEENATTNVADADTKAGGDDGMQVDEQDERDKDEIKEHTELLALPPHGSKVYVGGIPHDASEEDLKSFCESVGEVTEVWMMKSKDSSKNHGYAFLTFRTKELASKAIKDLNNTEFKGKRIKCSSPQTKPKLFRGKVLSLSKKKRGGKVLGKKAVCVKNLPKNITKEQLRKLFEYHGKIKKVHIPQLKSEKRFGFVHFANKSTALKALKDTEKYELNGDVLECYPAKPPADKKVDMGSNSQKGDLLPSSAPRGYGVKGAGHGPPTPDFVPMRGQPPAGMAMVPLILLDGRLGYGPPTPDFAPMMHERGQPPAGMAMVPLILPDGRLGYVLQQAGIPITVIRRGGGYSGSASGGGQKGQ